MAALMYPPLRVRHTQRGVAPAEPVWLQGGVVMGRDREAEVGVGIYTIMM